MNIEVRDEWAEDVISRPNHIAEIVRKLLSEMDKLDQDKEHIWVFMLNATNKIESIEHVSTGVIVACISHAREVFRRAVIDAATVIIIAHNHPSNNPKPSMQDDELTEILARSGSILGIPLVDHIIVTKDEYHSYRKEGRLESKKE
jgi:DNA repair protein RadC